MTDLTGRTVAVTGGANGIGRAVAEKISASGGQVAVLDADRAATNAVVDAIRSSGGTALGIETDVTSQSNLEAAFQSLIAEYGALDGLVTAAGVRQTSAPATELSLQEWDRVLNVDLTGTFLSSRIAARFMESGSIITIGSTSASLARLGQAAYCAAKAAVVSLTKVMALELAEQGIRVNCINPASTNTGLAEAWASPTESGIADRVHGNAARFRAGIPLGRLAEPGEIAEAAVFLLSEKSSFITGHALAVDGGETTV